MKGGLMSENIIEVKDLLRSFNGLTAVNRISFEVKEGEIFGFLGPNGAGKTTTINMLCTLLRPSGGTALVSGYDIRNSAAEVRRCIGLIFQDPSLDDRLTGKENLRFHAMLYNVERKRYEQRARELLAMVELEEKAGERVRTYSGGMKRRLEIARGLLHRPRVLFLDEPTIGLDPQTRRHIWDYLVRLREKERITMFMTTHYMDEAEHCDRIAIIDRGKIIALDTPDSLKSMVGGDIITLQTSDNARAGEVLHNRLGINTRPGPRQQLIVELSEGDRYVPRIVAILSGENTPLQVESVNLRRPTLDDVFLKLTGRAIREEEADQAREAMKKRMRMWRR
jgi:ABC-2 type transport system ATP-binding protein